jgi:pantoate--beta-alanine ligase
MTDKTPQIITVAAEVQRCIRHARANGRHIGLVPTMGALHEGHLSLVREAQRNCDFIAVTIFVNPTQFAPHEDFGKYPRPIENDLKLLGELGVDLVFMPHREELYPAHFSTFVLPPAVANRLEGESRPDHFQGVTTIVLKLFNLIPADAAFFGQKDYQQCQVIRQMAEDLNIPIEIRICPIVREPDGLAMSSRNRYLSQKERAQAVSLSQALEQAVRLVQSGTTETAIITESMRNILHNAGIEEIDYATVADAQTLDVLDRVDRPAVALVAARVGTTHLIDNMLLPTEST